MGKKIAAMTVLTEQGLTLLQSANSFVSIPGVGLAAEAALSLLAVTQTVKTNKEGFAGVGERACAIMVEVVRKVNRAEQPGSKTNMTKLEEECETLYRSMKNVQQIVEEHLEGRKHCVFLQGMLFSHSDQDLIKDCEDRLNKALEIFQLQGFIEIRLGVDEANKKLDDLICLLGEHDRCSSLEGSFPLWEVLPQAGILPLSDPGDRCSLSVLANPRFRGHAHTRNSRCHGP